MDEIERYAIERDEVERDEVERDEGADGGLVTVEDGMTTAEYAVGTLAACGFAALLYAVVTSGEAKALLTGLLTRALHVIS